MKFNPSRFSHDEMREGQEENRYGDKLCELCSDAEHQVYHHHMSSQGIRDFAVRHQQGCTFFCIMCKAKESTVRPATRKIILTSSTLYNSWKEDLKLPIHVEIEAIVGARIRDLTRAVIMLYLNQPERLEIILVAGLNNIGDCQSAEEIMDEIVELKQVVRAHSDMQGHEVPSVVSVSSILYAPKFCSLDVPENCLEWKPPAGFHNRRSLIEKVNDLIKAMNLDCQVNYLKLHMEGVRFDTKAGKLLHKHNPVKPIWREKEVRRRLHLTPLYKAKVVKNATKLFIGGLKNVGNWGK